MNKLKPTTFLLRYQVSCDSHNKSLFDLLRTFFSLLSWGNTRFRIFAINFSVLVSVFLSEDFADVGDMHFLKFFLSSFSYDICHGSYSEMWNKFGIICISHQPKNKEIWPYSPTNVKKNNRLWLKVPNKSELDRTTPSIAMGWRHMWTIS